MWQSYYYWTLWIKASNKRQKCVRPLWLMRGRRVTHCADSVISCNSDDWDSRQDGGGGDSRRDLCRLMYCWIHDHGFTNVQNCRLQSVTNVLIKFRGSFQSEVWSWSQRLLDGFPWKCVHAQYSQTTEEEFSWFLVATRFHFLWNISMFTGWSHMEDFSC